MLCKVLMSISESNRNCITNKATRFKQLLLISAIRGQPFTKTKETVGQKLFVNLYRDPPIIELPRRRPPCYKEWRNFETVNIMCSQSQKVSPHLDYHKNVCSFSDIYTLLLYKCLDFFKLLWTTNVKLMLEMRYFLKLLLKLNHSTLKGNIFVCLWHEFFIGSS